MHECIEWGVDNSNEAHLFHFRSGQGLQQILFER